MERKNNKKKFKITSKYEVDTVMIIAFVFILKR